MLDILVPISVGDLNNALTELELEKDGISVTEYHGAIPSIETNSDVPIRLIVCVDGGTREDVELLQRYLPTCSCAWTLSQNMGVKGFAYTLSELARSARNEFVAIVPGNILVEDPKWFGKMQVVFTKDPHCFMVAADVPNTVMASMAPFKLDHRRHPKSEFFLTRKAALQNVGSFEGVESFSRQALALGGTRWIAGGVRFRKANARETTGTV